MKEKDTFPWFCVDLMIPLCASIHSFWVFALSEPDNNKFLMRKKLFQLHTSLEILFIIENSSFCFQSYSGLLLLLITTFYPTFIVNSSWDFRKVWTFSKSKQFIVDFSEFRKSHLALSIPKKFIQVHLDFMFPISKVRPTCLVFMKRKRRV